MRSKQALTSDFAKDSGGNDISFKGRPVSGIFSHFSVKMSMRLGLGERQSATHGTWTPKLRSLEEVRRRQLRLIVHLTFDVESYLCQSNTRRLRKHIL